MSGHRERIEAGSTVAANVIRSLAKLVREQEAMIVVHPKDHSRELQAKVEATPGASYRVSKYVHSGTALVINPRLIEDLGG